MFQNALVMAELGAASLIITLAFRTRNYKEFWKWWQTAGIWIFTIGWAVLVLIALRRGWFYDF